MQRVLQVLKSSCLTPAMHSDLFYFPLLLQFSSSLSSFGLITSTWSCKWKMLPVNCSIHSHFVLHCWRQGARLFFPCLHGQQSSQRSWAFQKKSSDLPATGLHICMCTLPLQPALCWYSGEGHWSTNSLTHQFSQKNSLNLTMKEQQSLQSQDITVFPS